MNLEKVVFAFFIVLALTINFGFFLGGMNDVGSLQPVGLGAALAVSLIATIIKFGDRSQLGAVMLATSLVADLQLVIAALVWGYAAYATALGVTSQVLSGVSSLSGGALLANLVSVTLLVGETLSIRR